MAACSPTWPRPTSPLFDEGHPQDVHPGYRREPGFVAIAVQANPDIRTYLPFIAKVAALDALLSGETGQSALIFYGDSVEIAKPFHGGDLSTALRKLTSDGPHARAIDAGMLALRLLARAARRAPARFLLFIGQPADRGGESHLEDLRLRQTRECHGTCAGAAAGGDGVPIGYVLPARSFVLPTSRERSKSART